MIITLWIFIIIFLIVSVHTIIGCCIVPLQGALVIDATGHSVVYGVISGFLLSQSLHSPLLFIGAICSGLIMNGISYLLRKNPLISYDSSIGIAYSLLFSLGILLISLYARNIHLDLDMILLGNIEYALYDTIVIGSTHVPFIVINLSFFLLFITAFLYCFWKSIIILLFDRLYAKTRGLSIDIIQFSLIVLSSCVVVTSFNAMGALLLIAIAASPFGLSWHNTTSYYQFIKKSLFYNILLGFSGGILALYFNLPIAATVSCCCASGALYKVLFFQK